MEAVVGSNQLYKQGVPVPKKGDIPLVERVEVICQRPIGINDLSITAEIDPGKIVFEVGAEAYEFVRRQVYIGKHHIICGMHTFNAGLMLLGKWYFSDGIWQKVRAYDWARHAAEADEMLEQQEFRLEIVADEYEQHWGGEK